MQIPEVQFATSGRASIAWTQWGSGPDVLVVPPLVSNQELEWEHELYRRFLERFGRHLRVTAFDKRGVGISDRFDELPTAEQRVDDVLTVMDAAGLERPSLLGVSEGGTMAALFAVRHPDRVDKLILGNSFGGSSIFAEAHAGEDGSYAPLADKLSKFGRLAETWGRDPQFMVDWFAPDHAGNASFVRWVGRFQRTSMTSADLLRQIDSLVGLEAGDRLGEISSPTLVMHGVHDAVVPIAAGRATAAAIPGATFLELDTGDHFLLSSTQWAETIDIVVEFVTGTRPGPHAVRRFATVAFTDIVGSTTGTLSSGDDGWCDVLDSHDRLAWAVADRHRGAIVKSTGDGLLATFDAPTDAVDFCRELRLELTAIDLEIRCGLHAGEIEVRENGDIAGAAVNLAARVEHAANDGDIYVSSTVHDMVLGAGAVFEDRGSHHLKGFDRPWQLFALVG